MHIYWILKKEECMKYKNYNANCKIIVPINKRQKLALIGSGLISRRALIKPVKKKQIGNVFNDLLQNKKSYFSGQVSNKITQKAIPFKTTAAKIIFHYWNGLGFPFVRHRPVQNKTNFSAIEKINQNVKRYGKEKIIFAIKIGHELFEAKWFKYRVFIAKNKISLSSFFQYSSLEFKLADGKCHDMPRSWFKECLRGQSYLENKYSIALADSFPQITHKLVDSWKIYKKGDKLLINDNNNLIRCSKLLNKFCEINSVDALSILDIVDGMLNKWHTYAPKHSHYLINDIFWKDVLPKELVRYGLFNNMKDIKI